MAGSTIKQFEDAYKSMYKIKATNSVSDNEIAIFEILETKNKTGLKLI